MRPGYTENVAMIGFGYLNLVILEVDIEYDQLKGNE